MASTKTETRKYKREYMREYRKKESSKVYQRRFHQNYCRANYERLWELKKFTGCLRCELKDPRCLDFHHRDPDEKNRVVATMTAHCWTTIKAEIAKCEILCANCHRIETFRQQEYAGKE
ncbi:hypothetical protein LCGC14_0455090 [marine sediment metagenome]|uniref:HNH domain-containing protein n=1 Tax=marine sediment metagenome TaxID=412755 RepID=A0A0F9SGN3_9ZZZZ